MAETWQKAGEGQLRWTVSGRTTTTRASPATTLVVDVAGFEGPLDLLLHLARNQKVDLSRISVLALAEQYLAFIEQARAVRLELAADYLVMAAWLAFLKSRLLIPKQPGDEGESGEELAAVLQFRLKRLRSDARGGGAARQPQPARPRRVRAGRARTVIVEKRNEYSASLYDLLTAYAERARSRPSSMYASRSAASGRSRKRATF